VALANPDHGPAGSRSETFRLLLVQLLEQLDLFGPSPGQQRSYEAVLALEQEQEHAGAGVHRRRQGAQRHVGQTVLQDIAIGLLEQLVTPG
jgi:hypothetical protein